MVFRGVTIQEVIELVRLWLSRLRTLFFLECGHARDRSRTLFVSKSLTLPGRRCARRCALGSLSQERDAATAYTKAEAVYRVASGQLVRLYRDEFQAHPGL